MLFPRLWASRNLRVSTVGEAMPTQAEPECPQQEQRKRIRLMEDQELAKRYLIGGDAKAIANLAPLPESCHRGMDLVYATRITDGETLVVKTRSKRKSFKSTQDEREWRATTEYQLSLPVSEYLCQFYEVIDTPEMYYVFMERVEGKDLFEQTESEQISHMDAREIVRQILDALMVLHSRGRIHKDLKLENVVVDLDSPKRRPSRRKNSWRLSASVMRSPTPTSPTTSPVAAKVIDFDTVEDWEPSRPKYTTSILGSDGYIAPEAYGGQYSPASDVYAAGVIMYKLLTRSFPVGCEVFDDGPGENYVGSPAMCRIQERLQILSIDFQRPPFDNSPEAADLVERMLAVEPADRPSAADSLQHAWFDLGSDELR